MSELFPHKAAAIGTPAAKNLVETYADLHTPLIGYSTTVGAAVDGTHGPDAAGDGVFGTSPTGDGVHGEAQGANFQGAARIYTKGRKGVYGSSSGDAGYFESNVAVAEG